MSVEVSGEAPLRLAIPAYVGMVRDFIAREVAAQKARLFLWLPVLVSVGISIYFGLPSEPPAFLGIAAVAAGAAATLVAPTERRIWCFVFLLIVGGFAAAQFRTFAVFTPMVEKERTASIDGRIDAIEDMEDGEGSRLLLSHVQIERLEPGKTPTRVRVSVRSDEGLQVGQRVRVLAGLAPPSPPLSPGAFDFQRYMYFQKIGALGFAFKAPQVIGQPEGFHDFIERIRVAIDRRIHAVLGYPEAAVAMALITGRRAGISDEANDAITAAGLAHILSISGLHIGLVTGIIFFVTRLLMVCIPRFGVRQPVKKYAAGFALAGAVFYTLMAGATIPAQRSLIMTGVALLAIVMDRSPISMRLVAFAAFAVLLFAPESLISASFQMSFAAVAGLVLVFDWLRPQFSKWYADAGFVKRMALYFLSVCLTTIIATVATAPFTVFHFQQLSLYGLIANALAVPLSAFIIMPAAVAGVLAMPFGWEKYPLLVMGLGIDWMLDISVWTASLPHALLKIPAPPNAVLPCFVGGVMLLLLIKGPLKYIGVLPLIVSVVMVAGHRQPDILMSPEFAIAAVKNDSGLYVSTLRKEKFIREKWESSYGLAEGVAMKWPDEGVAGPLTCDEMACRAVMDGKKVSFLKNPAELEAECYWADVVLSFSPVPGCGKPVIDKFDALDGGAHALWLKDMTIRSAEETRGIRPWSGGNSVLSDKRASGSRAGPGF